jgi:hypothetical protein
MALDEPTAQQHLTPAERREMLRVEGGFGFLFCSGVMI